MTEPHLPARSVALALRAFPGVSASTITPALLAAMLLVGCSADRTFGEGEAGSTGTGTDEGDCDEWADTFWTDTQGIDSEREECSEGCPGVPGECDWSECDWICSGDYWLAKSELMAVGEGCSDFAGAYVAYDICHGDAFYAAAAGLSETEGCDDVPAMESALEAARDACSL